jgi:hypothetical protein
LSSCAVILLGADRYICADFCATRLVQLGDGAVQVIGDHVCVSIGHSNGAVAENSLQHGKVLSRSFIGSEPACLMLEFHLGKSVGGGAVLLVATAKNNKRGL